MSSKSVKAMGGMPSAGAVPNGDCPSTECMKKSALQRQLSLHNACLQILGFCISGTQSSCFEMRLAAPICSQDCDPKVVTITIMIMMAAHFQGGQRLKNESSPGLQLTEHMIRWTSTWYKRWTMEEGVLERRICSRTAVCAHERTRGRPRRLASTRRANAPARICASLNI